MLLYATQEIQVWKTQLQNSFYGKEFESFDSKIFSKSWLSHTSLIIMICMFMKIFIWTMITCKSNHSNLFYSGQTEDSKENKRSIITSCGTLSLLSSHHPTTTNNTTLYIQVIPTTQHIHTPFLKKPSYNY